MPSLQKRSAAGARFLGPPARGAGIIATGRPMSINSGRPGRGLLQGNPVPIAAGAGTRGAGGRQPLPPDRRRSRGATWKAATRLPGLTPVGVCRSGAGNGSSAAPGPSPRKGGSAELAAPRPPASILLFDLPGQILIAMRVLQQRLAGAAVAHALGEGAAFLRLLAPASPHSLPIVHPVRLAGAQWTA